MANGFCTHHEHVDESIRRIEQNCRDERKGIWKEVNSMKRWVITGLTALVLNLVGVIATLAVVLARG